MMPTWFHIAGVFLGSALMYFGVKHDGWKAAGLGFFIFGMACFALGGVL